MLHVSSRSLKILAALFWYSGSIVLMLKGSNLLHEADVLKPDQMWPSLALIAGLFIGSIKARFLFCRSCKKNLLRIDSLEQPKLWQFFRPGFFILLSLMITLGAILSRAAHANYPFLLGVAILDFSIAVALIGSSYIFWTHTVSQEYQAKKNPDEQLQAL